MVYNYNPHIFAYITHKKKRIFFILILVTWFISSSDLLVYGGEKYFLTYRRATQQEIARQQGIIEQDPIDFQSYFELGLIYLKLGKHIEEAHAYKEALSLKPKSALMHYNLSIAYDHLKDGRKAIHHMQIAQDLYTQKRNHLKIRLTQRRLKFYHLSYPSVARKK